MASLSTAALLFLALSTSLWMAQRGLVPQKLETVHNSVSTGHAGLHSVEKRTYCGVGILVTFDTDAAGTYRACYRVCVLCAGYRALMGAVRPVV